MLRIVLLFISVSLSVSSPLYAASRNCNSGEKQAANAQLVAIENDAQRQTSLINQHLPHGVHVSHDVDDNEHVFYQTGYILKHDADLRTALWVSYRLTDTDLNNASGNDRVNCFRRDPRMTINQTATPADYKEPIYDQGHMANDADLKHDLTQQINTYIMSNMSPQHCRFNRGIWLSLESLTRQWAHQYNTLYVTSGAIFDRDGDAVRDPDDHALRMESNNGKARVAVPSHYYKVILRQENNIWKGISFLIENTNDKRGTTWETVRPQVLYHITTLSLVETLTGLTLHPDLDRTAFSQNMSDWDFSTNVANFEASCQD